MDAQDKELRTPLLEAIINNHIEVARYLIQSGASVYHVVSLGPDSSTARKCAAARFDVGSSLVCPGGGRLHRPPPRCQAGEPGDCDHAAGDGPSGCKRTGKGTLSERKGATIVLARSPKSHAPVLVDFRTAAAGRPSSGPQSTSTCR